MCVSAMDTFKSVTVKCGRKKVVDFTAQTKLKRCLGLFDLTALGVGSTLGVGIYILAGQIAKYEAGPAVALSFLFAAFASMFAGLCYAEFGARVPKAGSAYVYSYVCVGEFIAFIIGWSMLLSYIIGASSLAKGFTKNIDSITGGRVTEGMKSFVSIDLNYLDESVDFLSFGLILLLTAFLCYGIKKSTILVNFLTALNLCVVLFVIIAGGLHINTNNWSISQEQLLTNYSNVCHPCSNITTCIHESDATTCGNGGYTPYGFVGIMEGAATAFYGFVGFDVIATVGEEVINPQKMIPISIVLSLFIVCLAYFGIASVITLAVPYFLQDSNAPLPNIFRLLNMEWCAWIIQIGAFLALFASLIGVLIPMPRIVWSMAEDGLIFHGLSKINHKLKTPVYATVLSGSISALMAAIFDLNVLIDLMSIGTLLAYTMVSACILILRYIPTEKDVIVKEFAKRGLWSEVFNLESHQTPTESSSYIATVSTWLFAFITVVLYICIFLFGNNGICYFSAGICVMFLITIVVILWRQPQSKQSSGFQVPLVPFTPALSIMINVYLMANLELGTWIQFFAYIIIGLVIYFGYGIRHSNVEARLNIENSSDVYEATSLCK